MSRLSELDAACRRVILETMRPGLRDAIDAALDKGATKAEVLHFVRGSIERQRRHAGEGGSVLAQVIAYLESK